MHPRSHKKPLRPLCGETGPGDGVDPREDFRSHSHRLIDRKTLQLCRQVRQTLLYVLSGECDDESLQGLDVVSVDPAPDATRLLVTVTPLDRQETPPAAEILERLRMRSGQFRSEVARSVHRRKAPLLTFQFVSGLAGGLSTEGGDR